MVIDEIKRKSKGVNQNGYTTNADRTSHSRQWIYRPCRWNGTRSDGSART